MNNLLFQETTSWMLIGTFGALLLFYEAYRIYKQNGVITETKLFYHTMTFVSFFQLFVIANFDINPMISFTILFSFFIIIILIRVFKGNKTIVIYEARSEIIFPILKTKLRDMGFSFEEKDGFHDEEAIYSITEEATKISIDGGILGDETKDYRISFKSEGRSYRIEELQLSLIEAYQAQNRDKIFWKQILTNCGLGVGIIVVLGFFLY
ncbi:hypothetical protein BKP45_10695 [Anaerobacillus alkalidiazotrophicus]|uniref:Uncharacterized protein n=1 Tax=Anaerobacillus alkalidiazotrophicus TaxID=472963 RepID=A0A1S2M4A1_9BACI|nr:hypothetical protein [Anaerobacillus alkalidiazotrophicus]OIJ18062.1 hypothetical protein BKP45_16410 [Anaerobacillus alkalidiazotrophicus]OIJ19541.1 hypothetical protein BKP45_10695 [Anaerobacillus alkalidiazotrophicus]